MADDNRNLDKDFKQSDPEVAKKKEKVNFTKGSVNEYKFYPDNPTSDYHKQKFASKGPSRYYDPCQESANMSVKCLEMNNFDRDMCTEYFKAYRECKKEWMRQRRSDIRSGEGGWS
jgi:cytochrome c oxidase assembly protein subunit 23